jgi:hypothetical protein
MMVKMIAVKHDFGKVCIRFEYELVSCHIHKMNQGEAYLGTYSEITNPDGFRKPCIISLCIL